MKRLLVLVAAATIAPVGAYVSAFNTIREVYTADLYAPS